MMDEEFDAVTEELIRQAARDAYRMVQARRAGRGGAAQQTKFVRAGDEEWEILVQCWPDDRHK